MPRSIDGEDPVMKRFSAFLFAGTLVLAAPAAITSATAAPLAKVPRAGISAATDFSAHRHIRRHHRHHGHHSPYYQPHYYDRPVYYRPYPYVSPAPFTFGIGFDPAW
jgi:hypothetical protein